MGTKRSQKNPPQGEKTIFPDRSLGGKADFLQKEGVGSTGG